MEYQLSTDGKELYVANHVSNKVDIIKYSLQYAIITSVDGRNPIRLSLGVFTTSLGCNGPPVTFSITVNPTAPTIIAGPVTGSISACVGTAVCKPGYPAIYRNRKRFNGRDKGNGTGADFQVSLSANSGYGSSVLLNQSGGKVANVVVYVRSAATATGSISGNVVLTSAGAPRVKMWPLAAW